MELAADSLPCKGGGSALPQTSRDSGQPRNMPQTLLQEYIARENWLWWVHLPACWPLDETIYVYIFCSCLDYLVTFQLGPDVSFFKSIMLACLCGFFVFFVFFDEMIYETLRSALTIFF